jgi:hypothetical protein
VVDKAGEKQAGNHFFSKGLIGAVHRGIGDGLGAPAQPRPKMARRTCKNKDGLPEGWVIDEEGYVVPRHG